MSQVLAKGNSLLSIDLNCDMGEGMNNDEALMEYVSSINIACGFHAGNASLMRKTVKRALKNQVHIGAHPSFHDLEGFGRRHTELSAEEVFDIMVYQIGALKAITEAEGGKLNHVKPHGALYNQSAKEFELAHAITRALMAVDPHLILYGLAGSNLIEAGKKAGVATYEEVFIDRSYSPDGFLTPRSESGALITDPGESIDRAIRLIKEKKIKANNGVDIYVNAQTICIHGDHPHALDLAKGLHQKLKQENIMLKVLA